MSDIAVRGIKRKDTHAEKDVIVTHGAFQFVPAGDQNLPAGSFGLSTVLSIDVRSQGTAHMVAGSVGSPGIQRNRVELDAMVGGSHPGSRPAGSVPAYFTAIGY